MIRGIAFTGVYYLLSFIYVLLALPTLAMPGRTATSFVIRSYTRTVRLALRFIAGIRLEVRGRENLPEGPFIVAAKHQSWGDGFMIYPEISNLTFVTGDHLEKFPFVSGILGKLGAIVIDTCGGGERKAKSLADGMLRARQDNRRILIYPEGHLAPPSHYYRYKPGVWHMQKEMDVPVVPVATNLGCFWQQESIAKKPGTAVLEFLEPIPARLQKNTFIERLTGAVESRTADLVAQAHRNSPEAPTLLPDLVKVAAEPLKS